MISAGVTVMGSLVSCSKPQSPSPDPPTWGMCNLIPRSGRPSADREPWLASIGAGVRPFDDGTEIGFARERPEGMAPVAAEAAGTERIGDRRVTPTDEEACLERRCHCFDDSTRTELGLRVPILPENLEPQLLAQGGDRFVEAVVGSGCRRELVHEGVEGRRCTPDGSEHVEADHVP